MKRLAIFSALFLTVSCLLSGCQLIPLIIGTVPRTQEAVSTDSPAPSSVSADESSEQAAVPPTQLTPTQPVLPTQPVPTQTPTQPVQPTQPAPTQPVPTQAPTQPAQPTQPIPSQPAPTQPAQPTQPAPTQPVQPTQPAPTQPASTQAAPTEPASGHTETGTGADGTSYLRRYDENARLIEEVRRYADGTLSSARQITYFFGSDTIRTDASNTYGTDGALRSANEKEYYPEGKRKTEKTTYADGSSSFSRYDEEGRETLYETCRAGGALSHRFLAEYYPGSTEYAYVRVDEWDEEGNLTRHSMEEYYESGTLRRQDRTYDDGSRYVAAYDEQYRLILEEEFYPNGLMQRHYARFYNSEGILTATSSYSWAEDGLLTARSEITSYDNGTTRTNRYIPSWDPGREFYYEYDPLGREVVSEWRELQGENHARSVTEYYGETDTRRARTSDLWDEEGHSQEILSYDEENREREHTWLKADGGRSFVRMDEKGRYLLDERFSAEGELLYRQIREYNETTGFYTYTAYTYLDEDRGAYYSSESWYNEEGTEILIDSRDPNGTRDRKEYDALHNVTLHEYWNAAGVKTFRIEFQYYAVQGWCSFQSTREWDDEGNEIRYTEETYSEDNGRLTYYSVEYPQDNRSTVYYYDPNGLYIWTEEYRDEKLVSRTIDRWDGEGRRTGYECYTYDEEGAMLSEEIITYHENEQMATYRRNESGHGVTYRELDSFGEITLEQHFYASLQIADEMIRHEDGSSSQKYWYENGSLDRRYEWNADGLKVLEEAFTEEGIRVRWTVRRPNGTSDERAYGGDGLLVHQYEYTTDRLYDRTYQNGRMIVERRSLRDDDHTYLGSTEWEYYEEDGVKKIRISESDPSGTMTGQKVVTDDGTIGWPAPEEP